jgi:Na+-transporting methylmalonyl-CoA/oxaloacetate decarboxylase gamma subunit
MMIKGFGDAILPSLLGIVIVFFALVLLMGLIYLTARIVRGFRRDAEPAPQRAAASQPLSYHAGPAESAAPAAKKIPAPGSLGTVKLNGVPDRTAAQIMAIVANESGKPLNEIRFISIKKLENKDKSKKSEKSDGGSK